MQKITLGQLRKNAWWWRQRGRNKANQRSRLAFDYELIRRVNREKRFLPFNKLPGPNEWLLATILETLFPLDSRNWRNAFASGMEKERGWTPASPPGVQWNLRLPDATLAREFLKHVASHRKVQGIRRPRPNSGRQNRGIPWRWAELLDIADFKLRPLEAGERHSLSQARHRARRLSEVFLEALERQKQKNNLPVSPNDNAVVYMRISDQDERYRMQMNGFTHLWNDIWPSELLLE
ncbi:MAG: hypothetical protein HZA90_24365 [Verrucomicrobia bacterium]|nr:hypothetical protein [Verrucomicrobiota bacterium]